MARKKVLITGAAGRIGRVVTEGLRGDYELRLLCHRTIVEGEAGEEVVTGDIVDLEAVEAAVSGVDAVVHLAAIPTGRSEFEDVLEVNIRGTYNVYEAARRAEVPRVVFASTNHVAGYYEKEGIYTTPEMPARPDSYYGVSKACGEDLGQDHCDAFGLSVICLRIGSFQPVDRITDRKNDRILATWLSYRDTVQLVRRSLEAEGIGFGVDHAISGNTRAYWDIQRTREELGYEPEDNAEEHA